jgi:hypothetical protein
MYSTYKGGVTCSNASFLTYIAIKKPAPKGAGLIVIGAYQQFFIAIIFLAVHSNLHAAYVHCFLSISQ